MQRISRKWLSGAVLGASVLGLTACATGGGYNSPVAGGNMGGAVAQSGLGTVTDVRQMAGSSGNYSGAAIGAVAGGAAANVWAKNQDRKRAIPTTVGVVAGALLGETVQQNTSGVAGNAPFYRVTVRLDNGAVRTFDYAQQPNVGIGTRVRVDGNQLSI